MEQYAITDPTVAPTSSLSATGYVRFSKRQKQIIAAACFGTVYWEKLSSSDGRDRELYYDAEQYVRSSLGQEWFYDLLADNPYRQAVLLAAFDNAPYFATYADGDRREKAAIQRTAELLAAKFQAAFGIWVSLPSALGRTSALVSWVKR